MLACDGDRFVSMICDNCGEVHPVRITCGDRACPSCRKMVHDRLKRKYLPMMEILDPKKLVFVTLTRRINGSDLQQKVEETRAAWRQLIRQNKWKCIQGGLYTIEIKWSEKYKGWNVHIHAVCELIKAAIRRTWTDRRSKRKKADVESRFGVLTIQGLSRAWQKLTGDSPRVEIAPVLDHRGGVKGVLGYILKYLTKAAEVGGRFFEYNDALRHSPGPSGKRQGYRLVECWGTWYPNSKNYRFRDVPKAKKSPLVCEECGNTDWWSEFEMRKILASPVIDTWTREEVRAGPDLDVIGIIQGRLFGF